LCEVYYFHTDQIGLPEEMSNSEGQLVWRASYKTWGNTVAESWKITDLDGGRIYEDEYGDIPQEQQRQQNLRFQGQYLDRDTGLHYNTFRYYDPDIGRFISSDPIGLKGGLNLGSYAPNPISWIDPWGWETCYDFATRSYRDTDTRLVVEAPKLVLESGPTAKPKTGTPNTVYVYFHDKLKKAIQTSIFNEKGNVIGHVDYKNHGKLAPSGHFHTFLIPGDPSSGHSITHHPYSELPPGWGMLPAGISPMDPITP
jgi:RHS repeat-associated protein